MTLQIFEDGHMMNPYMQGPAIKVDYDYLGILEKALVVGQKVPGRNGNTRRLICFMSHFRSTPLISVRKTAWKNALREWEWFMSGSNRIQDLHPSCHDWWKDWADKDPNIEDDKGEVRFNYSRQFRAARGHVGGIGYEVDQIEYLINSLRTHPYSRRACATTWNPTDMTNRQCRITNCHGSWIQLFVDPEDDTLHLMTLQRSVDMVAGLPHNWIQYWAFMVWLAHRSGWGIGTVIWIGGDVHLYEEHEELARKMLNQLSKCSQIQTPNLVYNPTSSDFKADDFSLDSPYLPIVTERAKLIV